MSRCLNTREARDVKQGEDEQEGRIMKVLETSRQNKEI